MTSTTTSNSERYRRYYRAIEPILQEPKNRVYTTAIFSFLAISLFSWYAIRPTIQTILLLRKEIAEKTIVNSKMEQKIGSLIEAQAAYEVIRPKLYLSVEAMPNDPEAINIVTQLRNLGTVSGVTSTAPPRIQVASVPLLGSDSTPSASMKSATKKQGEFPVTVILVSPYPSLKSFIDGITNMRRILVIESIAISEPQEEGGVKILPGSKMLRAVLKLTAYYEPRS